MSKRGSKHTSTKKIDELMPDIISLYENGWSSLEIGKKVRDKLVNYYKETEKAWKSKKS